MALMSTNKKVEVFLTNMERIQAIELMRPSISCKALRISSNGGGVKWEVEGRTILGYYYIRKVFCKKLTSTRLIVKSFGRSLGEMRLAVTICSIFSTLLFVFIKSTLFRLKNLF